MFSLQYPAVKRLQLWCPLEEKTTRTRDWLMFPYKYTVFIQFVLGRQTSPKP